MKSFFTSALLGLAALALVNLTTQFTGITIPINRLSLAASGGLGVPGVALLVFLNTMLL